MKKIILLILFVSILFFFPEISYQTSFASTTAKSMCVMEITSKRVLNECNSNIKLPMASTTKIMTAITAIESGMDLDEIFEISPKSVGISGTSIYLRKGEKLSLRQLLYGLMLVSGNDASVAIGEKVAGDVEHFVDMMNYKAQQIGAFNTHFENTHGLDEKGHYTTAYDLALIASYALNNDVFKDIVSTKYIQITSEEGKIRYLKNKNKLLTSLDGACGVKTGYTDDAGRCLVSAVERNGMTIVCVVLNCRPMFEESADLLNQAFNEYSLFDLTKNYDFSDRIEVENGETTDVKIEHKQKFFYPLNSCENDKIRYEYSIQESIEAPVEIGKDIGEVKIFLDNDLLFSEKIYTMENVKEKGILQKMKDVVSQW